MCRKVQNSAPYAGTSAIIVGLSSVNGERLDGAAFFFCNGLATIRIGRCREERERSAQMGSQEHFEASESDRCRAVIVLDIGGSNIFID